MRFPGDCHASDERRNTPATTQMDAMSRGWRGVARAALSLAESGLSVLAALRAVEALEPHGPLQIEAAEFSL